MHKEQGNPWHWLEQRCNVDYNAARSLLCIDHQAILQSANNTVVRFKQNLKRTAVAEQWAPTFKFSTNFVLITRISNQAADVKIIIDPFHSIKKTRACKKTFFSCVQWFWLSASFYSKHKWKINVKSPSDEASATTFRFMLEALSLNFLQTPSPRMSPKVSSKVLTKIMPAGEIYIVG
jgi:hypothetical protein